jgi:hypothetical protein
MSRFADFRHDLRRYLVTGEHATSEPAQPMSTFERIRFVAVLVLFGLPVGLPLGFLLAGLADGSGWEHALAGAGIGTGMGLGSAVAVRDLARRRKRRTGE